MEDHSKFKYKKYIFSSENSPLNSIPFHDNTNEIERYFSKDFPMHLAIHKIKKATNKKRTYVESHTHEKPEINILLGNLKYKITLGDEEYIVKSPANIWIPAGLAHSATVTEGEGYYICIILEDGYKADKK